MKPAEGRIENNIIENVSRRGFLQGALASGVFVLRRASLLSRSGRPKARPRRHSIRACGWGSHRMER